VVWGGHVYLPFLPEVVPQTDSNPVTGVEFLWGRYRGRSRSELDSPDCRIRRMEQICCFTWAL